MIGRRQEIEVGPMSGKSNVEYWLKSRGIEPTAERVDAVFARAKTVDRVLSDDEIRVVLGTLDASRSGR
jgi:2-isopropylmalate synthase